MMVIRVWRDNLNGSDITNDGRDEHGDRCRRVLGQKKDTPKTFKRSDYTDPC